MILVRLSPGPTAGVKTPNPEIVADVLWAAAVPEDRLEHVRARPGPAGGDIHIALFHNPVGCEPVADLALRLCRRAITTAPVLIGWTATSLEPAPTTAAAWAPGTEVS